MSDEEQAPLHWPNAARAVYRNKTLLRAVCLVTFTSLSVVLAVVGIYLRSWLLQFKIQELKDFITITNQPDSACEGDQPGDWIYSQLEEYMGCDARQREDFTRSDKELYDQCFSTHKFQRDFFCKRGRELHIYVFNITNPEEVLKGLTPKVVEIGRKVSGGPFVFYKDCKTFDTEFGETEVQFQEHCHYTYKFFSTEAADLTQQIVTPNVGLMEAMGNSMEKLDYIIPVVWGTIGLMELNATTTQAEDYIRGQLLSDSWPNEFGSNFLNEFSPQAGKAGLRAKDNAKALFEVVVDPQKTACTVNGTVYDRNQCISMANVLAIYARRYYEGYQTYPVPPYNLKYKEGAGLFIKTQIGDLLGYYAGHEDPLSSFMFPKKISWDVVHSQTRVQASAAAKAGAADSQNGILNPGPLGKSKVVVNELPLLGSYTRFQGRKHIVEFDYAGCRPIGEGGQVVVPQEGPYPPQCNGGAPLIVRGSRGSVLPPRVWSLQPEAIDAKHQYIFSHTLMRPMKFSFVEDLEADISTGQTLDVKMFELKEDGLKEARMSFNCEQIYKAMAAVGVVNRGSDCDMPMGMFDISSMSNGIPYVWSLPHFYLVESNDTTQHPRSNLLGLVTPTGPRYRTSVLVEPESGRIVDSMIKEQISLWLLQDSRNYFFTQHKRVMLPLYWVFDTRNVTNSYKKLLSDFQAEFMGLHAGFIVCTVASGICLLASLVFGMMLYRDSAVQAVREKRKKIASELEAALPPDAKDQDEGEDGDGDKDFM